MSDSKYLYWAWQASKDPQAHIDALVEAGVLQETEVLGQNGTIYGGLYEVVQPHKHEWEISDVEPIRNDGMVRLYCTKRLCMEARYVPNRLPIEVPE